MAYNNFYLCVSGPQKVSNDIHISSRIFENIRIKTGAIWIKRGQKGILLVSDKPENHAKERIKEKK